jgi:hypothetical protein
LQQSRDGGEDDRVANHVAGIFLSNSSAGSTRCPLVRIDRVSDA